MSETRHDFPGTTTDEPSEVDADRTASDTAPDTEPFVADAEPAGLDTDRTGSDSMTDSEPGASDSEPAASDTELDSPTAAFDAADRGLDKEEPAPGRAHLALGEPVVRPNSAAGPGAAVEPTADGQPGAGSDARWREIQATFVDDPGGSVEQALRAVDDEVTAVIDALRRRQEELAPVGQPRGQTSVGQAADQPDVLAAGSNPGDTERLRIALRECRAFWADLAELGDRLG
jgi:hypothetical protein